MMRIKAVALLSGICLLGAAPPVWSETYRINVGIRASASPSEVKLLPRDAALMPVGSTDLQLKAAPDGKSYLTDLAMPAERLEGRFLLVATWQTGRPQSLPLRLYSTGPKTLNVKILDLRRPAVRGTIDALDDAAVDFDFLIEKYFVARDVYREIKNHKNAVKQKAFKIWYDASFRLHTDFPFIGRDEEVIKLGEAVPRLAAQDPTFLSLLPVASSYYTSMNELFLAAKWSDVAQIQALRRDGKIKEAQDLNAMFLKQLQAAPADERRAVAKRQGITLDMLSKNASYLAAVQVDRGG